MNNEEDIALYDQVATEVQSGNLAKGLWLKCLSENNGNKTAAEAAYVKQRVKQLGEEANKERDKQEMARMVKGTEHESELALLSDEEKEWYMVFVNQGRPAKACASLAVLNFKQFGSRKDYAKTAGRNNLVFSLVVAASVAVFLATVYFAY
ncbi:MAG: hypothetical protein PF961_07725 [Planctomycetota bacterium]|jgi:hypothetical protein|nr:hypothetical protein [Planctomycetota bacterium]